MKYRIAPYHKASSYFTLPLDVFLFFHTEHTIGPALNGHYKFYTKMAVNNKWPYKVKIVHTQPLSDWDHESNYKVVIATAKMDVNVIFAIATSQCE